MRAAKYLGVAPWDLEQKPIWWTIWAIEAEQAENAAEKEHIEREKNKSKSVKTGRRRR